MMKKKYFWVHRKITWKYFDQIKTIWKHEIS